MLTRLSFSLSGFEKQQTRCTDVFVIFMRGSHRAAAASYSCMKTRGNGCSVNPDELQARRRYDAELLLPVKTNTPFAAEHPNLLQKPSTTSEDVFSRLNNSNRTLFYFPIIRLSVLQFENNSASSFLVELINTLSFHQSEMQVKKKKRETSNNFHRVFLRCFCASRWLLGPRIGLHEFLSSVVPRIKFHRYVNTESAADKKHTESEETSSG